MHGREINVVLPEAPNEKVNIYKRNIFEKYVIENDIARSGHTAGLARACVDGWIAR